MLTRRLLVGLLLSLPAFVGPAHAQSIKPLTILHTNDLHAHLMPNDLDAGGFARLATVIREEKAHCEACLYLNAGDLVQGTPVSTIFNGVPVYQIANLLGIDAATVGNHEFDYGWKRVQQFAKIAHFPLMSANVVDERGKTLTGKSYVIKNVGGLRVGIIGVVLGDLSGVFVTADQVGPYKVLPVVETVRKYAQEIRDKTDLIVVLGHIHDDEEVDAILKDVPAVSVVVVGHNHSGYTKMRSRDGRVAVLNKSYGVELGRLDLQVDVAAKKLKSAEWKEIPITSKIVPAADVAAAIAPWEEKASKRVDTQIGESKRRVLQPELKMIIQQAMVDESGADLAWINLGNVRDVLPQGKILERAIWNILPFDNKIVIGTFKGSQLPPKIAQEHQLDPNKTYTVATTDFTAANQAADDQLGVSGLQFPKTDPRLQRDMMIDWVRKKGVIP